MKHKSLKITFLLLALFALCNSANAERVLILPQAQHVLIADIIVYGTVQSVSDTGFYVEVTEHIVNATKNKNYDQNVIFVSHYSAPRRDIDFGFSSRFRTKPIVGSKYFFLLEYTNENAQTFNYTFGLSTGFDTITKKQICTINGEYDKLKSKLKSKSKNVTVSTAIDAIKKIKQCYNRTTFNLYYSKETICYCTKREIKKMKRTNKAFALWHECIIFYHELYKK
jgi:copper chaperone CopZ